MSLRMWYRKHLFFLVGTALVLLFLITRLYELRAVPIFTDEAIYVRWSQISLSDSNWRFISLTDGKQPLLIWLGSLLMQAIRDPLVAVRLVSVVAGLFTTVGVYLLAAELFKDRKTALFASFLYIIFPFALVYDKLAVYDSLVAAFATWSLYLEVLLVRYRRLDVALITAIVIGGGLLTKSSALFFIYLLPASVLLFGATPRNIKKQLPHIARWFGLCVIVIAGALIISSILRLSPYFHFIGDKNELFVYPVSEWVKYPFINISVNARMMVSWLVGYVTLPILFLAGVALVMEKKLWREKMLLMLWFVVPYLGLAFLGKPKFLFPRYILFMTIPLLILAAYTIVQFVNRLKSLPLQILALTVALGGMLRMDFYILTDFSKAPIPQSDKIQLISGYAAGIGVQETVDFLQEKSRSEKIYVGTVGSFGLMPQALQIYLSNNPNIEIAPFWPIEKTIPFPALVAAQDKLTYFVFYAPCDLCPQEGIAPPDWPLTQVFQIPRIQQNSYFTLYQVTAP